MKKAIPIISVMITLIIFSPTVAFSQDWPQWLGTKRDATVTGFKTPSTWPSELKQIWKVNVGFGDATPVLSHNRLYLNTRQGSDEVILCLDALTGKEIWKDQYSSEAVTGPASSHPGPRSTPAISDGKIVTFGATGILSCIEVASGKLLWRIENPTKAVPQFFTSMSPLIIDKVCIVHIGGKDKGEVLALNLETGTVKWKWSGDGPSYASPAIMTYGGEKQIIIQTEKNLIGLDFTNGKLLWQVATPVQQRFYNCSSPYINGQVIYYTGQGTGIKALEVIKSNNNFITKELWSNTEVGAKWNTPVLKNGFLYGFSDLKRIYCVNATSGKTAWIDNSVTGDFATLVDCGSVLIGLPSTGNLIIFKPDPSHFTQIAKYKVSETPVYAFPVIAGNHIYIKDAESVTLFSLTRD